MVARSRFALLLVAGLLAPAGCSRPSDEPPAPVAPASTIHFTEYYTLEQRVSPDVVPEGDAHPGGGFVRLGDDVIVMTGRGRFARLVPDPATGAVGGQPLPLALPLDLDAFAAAAPAGAIRAWFRAHGVLARPVADGWQVFVSHHVWDPEEACVAVAVSTATIDAALDQVLDGWSEVARLRPCLPIGGDVRGVPFAGLEAGGRMQWLDGDVLLLTTGDHQFDGLNRPIAAAQRDDYDYGKTLRLDVVTGAVTPYSKGHRNPQGLAVAADGRIWETEHGPRGGDELNLLSPGGNYGWPFVTYGTEYNFPDWPPSARASTSESYAEPVFAWVPSIGVSDLIEVISDRFPRWRGNLLVSSLGRQSLFRVVLSGDRVAYVEPIEIRRRLRDVIEAPDGDIWLWTDEGDLITLGLVESDERGQVAFAACAACHTLDSDRLSGALGPGLYGAFERPVASNPSYAGYSDALRQLGGRWTADRLDAYLADPSAVAPGTTMTYRVESAGDRQALIEFLGARR